MIVRTRFIDAAVHPRGDGLPVEKYNNTWQAHVEGLPGSPSAIGHATELEALKSLALLLAEWIVVRNAA